MESDGNRLTYMVKAQVRVRLIAGNQVELMEILQGGQFQFKTGNVVYLLDLVTAEVESEIDTLEF